MSSSNTNNNGGWLTTKKRGRDDVEIEQAKQAAKERRKQQNNRGGRSNAAASAGATAKGGKKKQAVAAKGKNKKKKTPKDDYEEDDFLVEDSDDEEEEEEELEFDEDDEDDDDEEISEALSDDDNVLIAATKSRTARTVNSSSNRLRRGGGAAVLQKRVTYSPTNDSSDDDDDEDFAAPSSKAAAAAAARGNKTSSNNDSGSSSSSDEGDSFLPDGSSYPRFTSRAAPHMSRTTTTTAGRRPTAAAKRASNKTTKNGSQRNTGAVRSVLEEYATSPTETAAVKKNQKQAQKDGSDDDDIFKRKKATATSKSNTTATFSIESSSSDDDDDLDLLGSKKPKAASAVAAAAVDLTTTLDDDDTDNDDTAKNGRNQPPQRGGKLKKLGQKKPLVTTTTTASATAAAATKSRYFSKTTKSVLFDDDDQDALNRSSNSSIRHEEGETPVGSRKTKGKRRVVAHHHDSDDDDEEEAEFHAADMDSDMDEDEQTALALALSQSAAEAASAATKKPNKKSEQAINVDLQDSDDENNDDNDDDGDEGQDAFVDEDDPDAKTADMVLTTANQLSAQILQTMTQWIVGNCKNDGDDENDKNAGPKLPPVGMIVDGALAMADMSSSSSGGNDDEQNRSDWISRETMREICPNVTLANYQLIGVNWMALLHGMKVQVGSSPEEANHDSVSFNKKNKKKYINVNGIMADEMGLGKTVQTICFLAWLKHTRQIKGTNDRNDEDDDEQVLDSDNDDILTQRQVLAAKHSGPPRPPLSLVVAPSSVLSNWEREFEKFAPHMKVVKYHGSITQREDIQEDLRRRLLMKGYSRQASFVKRKKDSDLDTSDEDDDGGGVDDDNQGTPDYDDMSVDVILAPVTYFQQEKSNDRVFLRKLSYEYLVVDEAHLLKNARGLRYKNLDRFRTAHRLLLTGTPVQNSPAELICLLSFATRLFSRSGGAQGFDDGNENDGGESMLKHFVEAHRVNSGSKGGGSKSGDDDGYAAAYKKLKQLFSPFVLRRRKVDVLSQIMPPKERRVEFVTLDEASRAVYDSILYNHINGKKKRGVGSNSGKDHVFTQLRKAAHHPLLLRTRYTSATEKEHLNRCFHSYGAFKGSAATLPKVAEELEKFNDFDIHLTALDLITENPCRQPELERYILKEEDLFSSPKFVLLRALLPQLVADGHRVLIFSVWTSCIDLLTCLMESMNIKYQRMQGDTAVQERQGLIDNFNNDPSIPVFLLSTTACGLGINLTSADTCIMHDISFNPFNDLQAEDRCHRIGQKRPVTVIKLVTQDTVDNDIFEMQERKAKMNAAIMENNNNESSEWNNKQAQQTVLRTALDRFLKSPPTRQKRESNGNNNNDKEDISSSTTTTSKEKKQDAVMAVNDGLCKENKDNCSVLSDSTEL